MSILFLSDGRPSDAWDIGKKVDHRRVREEIILLVRNICKMFKERLTFGFIGFAYDDGAVFKLLEEMSEEAIDSGSNGIFSSGLDTFNLKQVLKLMTQSLTSTRTKLSSMANQGMAFNSLGRIQRKDHV